VHISTKHRLDLQGFVGEIERQGYVTVCLSVVGVCVCVCVCVFVCVTRVVVVVLRRSLDVASQGMSP